MFILPRNSPWYTDTAQYSRLYKGCSPITKKVRSIHAPHTHLWLCSPTLPIIILLIALVWFIRRRGFWAASLRPITFVRRCAGRPSLAEVQRRGRGTILTVGCSPRFLSQQIKPWKCGLFASKRPLDSRSLLVIMLSLSIIVFNFTLDLFVGIWG